MTDDERQAWFARRYEDDRTYIAWRRQSDPDYVHPWPPAPVPPKPERKLPPDGGRWDPEYVRRNRERCEREAKEADARVRAHPASPCPPEDDERGRDCRLGLCAAAEVAERLRRERDGLLKLAGIVIADAEAMDRGWLQYVGEYEGAVQDRASAARRILAALDLDPPPSPYGTDMEREA